MFEAQLGKAGKHFFFLKDIKCLSNRAAEANKASRVATMWPAGGCRCRRKARQQQEVSATHFHQMLSRRSGSRVSWGKSWVCRCKFFLIFAEKMQRQMTTTSKTKSSIPQCFADTRSSWHSAVITIGKICLDGSFWKHNICSLNHFQSWSKTCFFAFFLSFFLNRASVRTTAATEFKAFVSSCASMTSGSVQNLHIATENC